MNKSEKLLYTIVGLRRKVATIDDTKWLKNAKSYFEAILNSKVAIVDSKTTDTYVKDYSFKSGEELPEVRELALIVSSIKDESTLALKEIMTKIRVINPYKLHIVKDTPCTT